MTLAWPDVPSAQGPGKRVREQLDYIVWVAEAAEAVGLHVPPDLEAWRERVQRAYTALVDPMVTGHGDPLPPDVPPSTKPGVWPDVPSAGIEGMTVRHQLTVIRTIADGSRRQGGVYHQPAETARWVGRVQTAADAMNHGPALPMPDTARTPSPPSATPPHRKGRRAKTAKARGKGSSTKGGARRKAKSTTARRHAKAARRR